MIETEAKTLIEALEDAKNQLGTENILYQKEEIKGKLFKSGKIIVKAISYKNLIEEIENYLKQVIEGLGLEVKFESNMRDEIINITMYSNNNPILIGKNGQTLKALEMLVKGKIIKDWQLAPKIILDVENYKEKRINQLERLAIKLAKEVKVSKIPVEMDNMNSYERRIIHNKLSHFKGVATKSIGEEPKRHIVITPIEENQN